MVRASTVLRDRAWEEGGLDDALKAHLSKQLTARSAEHSKQQILRARFDHFCRKDDGPDAGKAGKTDAMPAAKLGDLLRDLHWDDDKALLSKALSVMDPSEWGVVAVTLALWVLFGVAFLRE